ncbi:chaperonin 10-like protein [Xylogone sp. PMI_703]|nr:chaperonin 10-like protein [Xylogone sp. PMI_703]
MNTNYQKAIKVTTQPGIAALIDKSLTPSLRDDYILAETRAFALNPTDLAQISGLAEPGTTVGTDWSGVVLRVGRKVTRFHPGDQVYGTCRGGNYQEPEDGAFAEIVACKELVTSHKPQHLTFEEAVTLGAGLVTVGQALYWTMKLPLPKVSLANSSHISSSSPHILVHGGSSATGTLAIQTAILSGCLVSTTCSASNFKLFRSRGASYIFDYNEQNVEKQILKIASETKPITYIVDCIGSKESATLCAKVLSQNGGHYHSIRFPLLDTFKILRPEDNVYATSALGYTWLGEEFSFRPNSPIFPSNPDERRFAEEWQVLAETLVCQGIIKPHPVINHPGGLDELVRGLNEYSQNQPRGAKLVYSRIKAED